MAKKVTHVAKRTGGRAENGVQDFGTACFFASCRRHSYLESLRRPVSKKTLNRGRQI